VPPNVTSLSDGANTKDSNDSSSLTLTAEVSTDRSVRLLWDPGIGKYNAFQIYQIFGTTEISVATATSTMRTFTLDVGELYGSTLTFKIRGSIPGQDPKLGDSASAQVMMPPIANIWKLVTSAGPSPGSTTKIHHRSDLNADAAFIHLLWELKSGAPPVAVWKLFRSDRVGGTSLSSEPIYQGTSPEYLDLDQMTSGKRWYYLVAGYAADGSLKTLSKETYVRVPPQHQVLLHRESANYEMCGLLAKTVDPVNYNRCEFTGIGSTGTYYDFGKLLFVDRYELGINTPESLDPAANRSTYGTVDANAPCGDASWGCLKTPYMSNKTASTTYTANDYVSSNLFFPPGHVTYGDAGNANKYAVKKIVDPTDTSRYCLARAPDGNGTSLACRLANNSEISIPAGLVDWVSMFTNAPKKVPASNTSSRGAFALAYSGVCSLRQTSGFGQSRVPKRPEQVLYFAWPLAGELNRESYLTPFLLEQGGDHLTYGVCATNIPGGNTPGLGWRVNDADFRATGSKPGFYTFPYNAYLAHTSASLTGYGEQVRLRSDIGTPSTEGLGSPAGHALKIITGSTLTRNCVSRYGVQDHIGNGAEVIEFPMSPGAATDTAEGDGELWGFKADGSIAPGASRLAVGTTGGITRNRACVHLTSSPVYGTTTKAFTHFLPTIGLPFLTAGQGALPVGEGAGSISLSKLGSDSVCVDASGTSTNWGVYGTGYATVGGSSANGPYSNIPSGRDGVNPLGPTDGDANAAYRLGKGRWNIYASNYNLEIADTAIRCVTEDN
jgi:hypothetical protein